MYYAVLCARDYVFVTDKEEGWWCTTTAVVMTRRMVVVITDKLYLPDAVVLFARKYLPFAPHYKVTGGVFVSMLLHVNHLQHVSPVDLPRITT